MDFWHVLVFASFLLLWPSIELLLVLRSLFVLVVIEPYKISHSLILVMSYIELLDCLFFAYSNLQLVVKLPFITSAGLR